MAKRTLVQIKQARKTQADWLRNLGLKRAAQLSKRLKHGVVAGRRKPFARGACHAMAPDNLHADVETGGGGREPTLGDCYDALGAIPHKVSRTHTKARCRATEREVGGGFAKSNMKPVHKRSPSFHQAGRVARPAAFPDHIALHDPSQGLLTQAKARTSTVMHQIWGI